MGHFERCYDFRVQVLRTDGGGEYANIDLFCERTGIVRKRTEADHPASNGKAERMHRTFLNMARCMIFNCRLPMHFWGDAVQYAAHVLNRSPCKANPKRSSPIEMLEGRPPNLIHVVTFGSPCMVYRKPEKNSLKNRSQRGLILGVSEEVNDFRVYLIDDKKVANTQHVKYIQTLSRAQNLTCCSLPVQAEMTVPSMLKVTPGMPPVLPIAVRRVERYYLQHLQNEQYPKTRQEKAIPTRAGYYFVVYSST